jgi:hypothetical protein
MKNNLSPWAITLFLLGTIGVVFPYIFADALPGDIGDARFNLYVLEHFYLALTGQVDGFIDAPFFYPLTKTILFSDNHWGDGLIYSYFRFFDATPIDSFAYWFFVGFILNYWSAFYVLRKFELSQLAAAIGAFLFTFGLPVIAQDGHCQLIYRLFVPLAILAFHNYTKSRNFYYLTLTLLMFSLQLLTSVYNGIFLAYFLFFWATIELRIIPLNRIRNFLPQEYCLRKSLPVLALAIITLLVFAFPYFAVKNLYHFGRSLFETSLMMPRIQSYFLGDRSNLWFSDLAIFSQIPTRWEHQMFIGIGALIALFFLFLHKGFIEKNSLTQKFIYTLSLMIFVTLFLEGFSLFYFFALTVPGTSAIRAVSREILVMLFPLSYLVGFTIDKIRGTSFATLSSSAVVFIICFLVVIDPIFANKSIASRKEWEARLDLLQSKFSTPLDKSSIISVSSKTIHYEIDAMLLAQKLGIKTINGYSGNYPNTPKTNGYELLDNCDRAKERIKNIETIMRSTKQNFSLDRSKIVGVGFRKKCDFTTSR